MGASLPKACDSAVIERHGTKSFEVSVAEINGFRTDMEDAHLIYVTDEVGVFGVYDGHGGKDCSKFAARRIHEELEKDGVPKDDAAWEELFVRIDKEFLDSAMSSGTTATMCVVYKPKKAGEKHKLHVVNAGDSRTLLGKADGSIVDGGGTDMGLTRDHKPTDPEEATRIVAAGGEVKDDRVNGNLSVSRGFGDRDCKETGGPGPDNRPVTCIPEQFHFECDETDFVLLVCDGVSEGNFSNEEVVKLVAESLKEGKNAGQAARLVCLEAITKDSKDNITCMVVQLQGVAEAFEKRVEFIAGSVGSITNAAFRTAYVAMAQKAGLSLAQAVGLRYEQLQEELLAAPEAQELLDEAEMLGTPSGEVNSDERKKWAKKWLQDHPAEAEEGGGSGMPGGLDMNALMGMLGGKGGAGGVDTEALKRVVEKYGGNGSGKGGAYAGGDAAPKPAAREVDPRVSRGPEVGDTVVVHGLAGAKELNGKKGKVEKWTAATGRWEVQLEGVKGMKGLKVENLRIQN